MERYKTYGDLRDYPEITDDDYRDLYAKAVAMAVTAHRGQKDKAGCPYFFHLSRVSEACDTKRQKVAAVLHDILEDTDYVMLEDLREDLLKDYPEIADAVDALTRREGESYSDFIKRVSLDPIAIGVKIRDLEDNLDSTRMPRMTDDDWKRMAKYHKARRTLIEEYERQNSKL